MTYVLIKGLNTNRKSKNLKPIRKFECLESRLALSVSANNEAVEFHFAENLETNRIFDITDYLPPAEHITSENGSVFLGNPFLNEKFRNILVDDNVNAQDTANADQLQLNGGLNLNLTGTGVTVGLWEAGGTALTTHQEFGARVTAIDAVASTGHATHVAGTIGASGVLGTAEGMAPSVTIRSRDTANEIAEINADAATIDLSNHSYSSANVGWTVINFGGGVGNRHTFNADRGVSAEDPVFGKYTALTQSIDDTLFNNPNYLSIWSAGNERDDQFTTQFGNQYVTIFNADPGPFINYTVPGFYLVNSSEPGFEAPGSDGNNGNGFDSLNTRKVAKNSLIVGAIEDILADPYDPAVDANIAIFSSYGPTDDGRIKPDVVANGVDLTSSWNNATNGYAIISGTSMATPSVTGTTALLVEHYRNLFNSDPTSATLKGLLIHTAGDAGNVGPDYQNGWGVVDAAAAANLLTNDASLERDDTIIQGSKTDNVSEVIEYHFFVESPEEFKATIVWTDPAPAILPGAGLDDATSVLVNDLDITVIGPGGSPTTFNPWTLDPANPNNAAVRTGANHLDNVEQVVIDAPVAGWYTVQVSQTGGLLDSNDQDFAILVSGDIFDTPDPPNMTDSSDTGSDNMDDITKDQTPTFTGTVPADSFVQLFIGEALFWGSEQLANGSTSYSITPTAPISSGVYDIAIKIGKDISTLPTNFSNFSSPLGITIDTSTMNPSGTRLSPSDDTGISNSDGITMLQDFDIVGTAEPGSSIELKEGFDVVGTATTNSLGNFIVSLSGVSTGQHLYRVVATDVAGNSSLTVTLPSITVDIFANAPLALNLPDAQDSGMFNFDNVTNETDINIKGTAEANSSVELFNGGVSIGNASADGAGNFSVPLSSLAEGDYIFTARATDLAGNVSLFSSPPLPVTVDTTGPHHVITRLYDDQADAEGDFNEGLVVLVQRNVEFERLGLVKNRWTKGCVFGLRFSRWSQKQVGEQVSAT